MHIHQTSMTKFAVVFGLVVFLATCSSSREFLDDVVGDDGKQLRFDDCQGHLEACLESPLSKRPGGSYGHSLCQDCHRRCKADKRWPIETWDEKTCIYWEAK